MHRPERLAHPVATVGGQLPALLGAVSLAVQSHALDPYLSHFCVSEHVQPARGRSSFPTVNVAIFDLRKPTALRRLDMHRPSFMLASIFTTPRYQQRASNVRKNPIWNDIARTNLGARRGRIRRSGAWQDKRRAVGWGAGCWNYWKICASQLPTRLASSTENGAVLALLAPSRTLGAKFATALLDVAESLPSRPTRNFAGNGKSRTVIGATARGD